MASKKIITMFVMLVTVLAAGSRGDTITGSGTANYLPKFTGSYVVGNSVISESSGNVGIGVANPASGLLEVAATGNNRAICAYTSNSGYPCAKFMSVNNSYAGDVMQISSYAGDSTGYKLLNVFNDEDGTPSYKYNFRKWQRRHRDDRSKR